VPFNYKYHTKRERRRRGMTKSEKNLSEAFAGESQANRKYLAFAKQADKEGFSQVAKLFRAAAAAETVHAHSHLKQLKGVKSTKENLEAAVKGETFEFKNMYPQMIKNAEEEGNKGALRSFKYANDVEKVHAELYQKALDNLGSNEEVDIYVCDICGYTAECEPPDECPVCKAKKQAFKKID
jgi:rubrerythrin